MDILTEKHRPKNIKNFVGNEAAVHLTKQFFTSWIGGRPKIRSLLFYGPPGIGKTSLALLSANASGQNVIHHNASDLSKSEDMKELQQTSKLGTFDETEFRITIVDECERISTAGQKILAKIVSETLQPMILICNDIMKVSYDVKKNCMTIPFKPVPESLIKQRIIQIANIEKKKLPNDIIDKILMFNKTVRGAVNSLQDYLQSGEVSEMSRDLDFTEIEKLGRILEGQNYTLGLSDNGKTDKYLDIYLKLEDVILWLGDSNLKDYGILSDISLIQHRVYETQDYYLEDVARAMINNCRGKLWSEPTPFSIKNRLRCLNMLKPKEEKEDQIIKMGTKKQKKGSSSPKMLDYKEEKSKDADLGEFF